MLEEHTKTKTKKEVVVGAEIHYYKKEFQKNQRILS